MTVIPLPRYSDGDPGAARHALLLHGLSSRAESNALLRDTLLALGWHTLGVDLRGHGAAGPTAEPGQRYRIADYAGDVAAISPTSGRGSWDLVVAHSLGGAISATIAAARPAWASRLILIDPALFLDAPARERLRRALNRDRVNATVDHQAAKQPKWSAADVEIKVSALRLLAPRAIDGTIDDNDPWDVRSEAERIAVPTLLLAADPALNTLLPPAQAAALCAANPQLEYRTVPDAGHSPHRDRPAETAAEIRHWLAASGG